MNVLAYAPQFLQGALITLGVAVVALVLGTGIGLALGWVKAYSRAPFRMLAEAYSAIVRGVPDLIIIYLIYFGGTVALAKLTGHYVDINGFSAGVFALAFIFGAYVSDVFRGAIKQVAIGQTEAAKSLGLPSWVAFLKVVLPQAWRFALPGFGNLAIILLKQTSLISVIGLQELLRASAVVSGATREPFYAFSIAAVLYLLMTSAASYGLRLMRIRSNRGFA
ncbi:polar amino acid transport system permease protein/arginine transport system permease protein [Rhizobiales bacterium GAS113]|nr:polar amino acid transport system permease protein/arginine transport system permease protein [Rhizobiales bacterium GAS113]